MKRICCRVAAVGLVLLLGAIGAARAADNSLGAGARWHVDNPNLSELPYDRGDWSYFLEYEYAEEIALWQIVADWAPRVGGTNNVDYVVTPQLNLIFKDRIFRGGGGVLASYVHGDKSDWTNPYFQLLLGLEVPIFSKLAIEATAFYPFKDLESLRAFEFRQLEFGAALKYTF